MFARIDLLGGDRDLKSKEYCDDWAIQSRFVEFLDRAINVAIMFFSG
jgi:hypothetical protein